MKWVAASDQCDHIGRIFATLAKIYKSLANFYSFFSYLAKYWTYFEQKWCISGLIFIVANGQILKHNLTVWSHCFWPLPTWQRRRFFGSASTICHFSLIKYFDWEMCLPKTHSHYCKFCSGKLRFLREIEKFLSMCWCSPQQKIQTASSSGNQP